MTYPLPRRIPITYSPSWTLIPTHYCRNTCGYCVFVERTGERAQLLAPNIAEAQITHAAESGATELLIMSGEAVETFRDARRSLKQHGFDSYIDYLVAVARRALAHNILPHINIGNLCRDELRSLREVAPSLGMMIETLDRRLLRDAAHARARDKDPARRLQTLHRAGQARVPFTTGLLIGIGESEQSRVETLEAIADVHRTYGHIQEVIIQPFKPHPGTAMAHCEPPRFEELRDTVRIARDLLPAEVTVQIPPNIAMRFLELVKAGARDLGGISPDGDRINPAERWLRPELYRAQLKPHGFTLHPRLAVYEPWATPGWLSPETHRAVARVQNRLIVDSG